MPSAETDRRDVEPPPGFVVARSSELDPLFGSSDRWGYRGQVDGRSFYRCGLESRAVACRAAWEAYGDA
jgi:hypothetical protein